LTAQKIVVHSDIFLDHLHGGTTPSVLRLAMGKFFCYATVFQAIHLFSIMRSKRQRRAVEDVFSAVKLLGMNPKNAERYGRLIARCKRHDPLDILVACLCLDSKLPILTGRGEDFEGIPGLKILRPSLVLREKDGRRMRQP
jgi:predicted nucleic acid-binding protein